MDFNQIRYFLALADTLNFTKAAAQCTVSQPALTQGIKRLEEELGGQLIERDGAQSALTILGESLRDQFRQLDHTRKLVKATAQSILVGSQAQLNLGVMCTVTTQKIVKMLEEYRAIHPKVSLVLHDVVPETVSDLLLSGSLDGVFCSRQGLSVDRIRYVPLFDERMVVAHARDHSFGRRDVVSLKDVAAQPYVDRLLCEFRSRFLDYVHEHDLELDIAVSSQREDWIQGLVGRGIGVAILPEFAVENDGISITPVSDPGLSRKVGFAIRNRASLTEALASFVSSVESYEWLD